MDPFVKSAALLLLSTGTGDDVIVIVILLTHGYLSNALRMARRAAMGDEMYMIYIWNALSGMHKDMPGNIIRP